MNFTNFDINRRIHFESLLYCGGIKHLSSSIPTLRYQAIKEWRFANLVFPSAVHDELTTCVHLCEPTICRKLANDN